MYDQEIRFAAICGVYCIAGAILLGALKFITHPSLLLFIVSALVVFAFTATFILHIRGFIFLSRKLQTPYLSYAASYFILAIVLYWILQTADLAAAYFIAGYHTPAFVESLFFVFALLYLVGGFLVCLSVFCIRRNVGGIASWYLAVGLIWMVYLFYSSISGLTLIGSIPVLEIVILTVGTILLFNASAPTAKTIGRSTN